MTQQFVELSEIFAEGLGSVNPASHVDECFELYSIPAFDAGKPEVKAGAEIGSSKQVVKPGDVLLSKIVPHIRRSWIVGPASGKRIIASGEWIVFRGERFDPKYLRHVLVGDPFHLQFMNTVAGVGGSLLRARPAHVAKIKIPLPPLLEQKRIAEILDRAEALRAKRRAALALLDELTQSIFLDMFGDPVSNPKGWETGPIGDLLSVKHGFAFKSEFFADSGPFVLLTPGNFYETGGYRDRGEKQKFYVGPIPDGYILEKDDLLVAMTEQAPGLLGSPILIPSSKKFLHNQRLGLLELTDQADRHFIYALFNTPAIRNRIQASSTGTKVKHTSPTKITSIEIPIPPTELQKDFAEMILSITSLQKSHLRSILKFDQLFATLQHRAFRGEL